MGLIGAHELGVSQAEYAAMPCARMALLSLGVQQKSDAMDAEIEKAKRKHDSKNDDWPPLKAGKKRQGT